MSVRPLRVALLSSLLSLPLGCSDDAPVSGAGGATGSSGAAAGASRGSGSASSGGGSPASTGGSAVAGGPAGGGGVAGVAGAGGLASAGSNGGGGDIAGTGGVAGAGGVGAGGNGGGGGTAQAGSGGTGSSGGAAAAYQPCPTDGSACKILPFGDSITDGAGTSGAYRVELFRLAHQAGANITFVGKQSNGPSQVDGVPFPQQHEGHIGYTIENIGNRTGIAGLVSTIIPELRPHIITLMIGTNDAIDDADLGNAPARLGKLIDSIYALLPDVLLIVAQPIPSQDTALNGRIRTYNAALPMIVKARADAGRHIELVDMYAPFSAKADFATALLKDTWHPNEAGHVILGGVWYGALSPHL